MSDKPVSDLVSAIDLAAEYLLKQASAPSTVEGVEPATLAEQVKAFQAVVAWADKRREILPPEVKESKFDQLRSNFSETGKRRRRSRAAEEGNGAGDELPAAGAPLDA